MHTELLFSYGTLRLESVQIATFGRLLTGTNDVLEGYELVSLKIDDPEIVRISGKDYHTMARFSGRAADEIPGTVFALTADELQRADEYEVPELRRVAVMLKSGTQAWVYVDAGYSQ